MSAPLKLKSERVGKVKLASHQPYISVLVDTGVFHLDQAYDYSLPEKFEVKPGQWVSVPFHGRNCLGLVVERSSTSSINKVQPINRMAKGPQISAEHLRFYQAVAARWATPIFDVLRFVTKFVRENEDALSQEANLGEGKRSYLQLPPNQSEIDSIREIARKVALKGSTLVIVPEARLAEALLDEQYEVASRSGVLSPKQFKNVIVVREESEHHYELKSPGFNTRDVALLRSEFLHENLLFIGYSPSIEMTRLIDIGFIPFKKATGQINLKSAPSQQGELIPSALFKELKSRLAKGRVLVVVPSKGYGLAISCGSCRNIAKCQCGGKISKSSKTAAPTCVICSKTYSEWRCSFCKSPKIYLLGRGIEKIAEDLGKTFPNHAIHISTADKEIVGEVSETAIVISTIGVAPALNYEAVLILEGINLGADLRSEERYLSNIFRLSTYTKGAVLLVERTEHPAVNALYKWNPLLFMQRMLKELEAAKLPPYSRFLLISSDDSDRIYTGLLTAVREKRIPSGTNIYNIGNGIVSVMCNLKNAKSLLLFIYEFQKKRSLSGKKLIKLRVDPYLLG